jgi:hypothetical protein
MSEVKGERSKGAKRQSLDRMTRPNAEDARPSTCGPVIEPGRMVGVVRRWSIPGKW